jgi:hypothetical protein
MIRLTLLASVAFCISPAVLGHDSPRRPVPTTKPEYMAMVRMAAPPATIQNATILMPDGRGDTLTLQLGTNGFTCDAPPRGIPKCADEGGMAWLKAIRSGGESSDKTGIIYMLGNEPDTNHHHHTEAMQEHTSWAEGGPHVMIVGRGAREAANFLFYTQNANPEQAVLMYSGTKYEHLMLPMPAGKNQLSVRKP